MCRIKIKNFGLIKEGFVEDEGYLDIRKITVFIGNQATGKSCIAKLISTFKWIEKALYRGDLTIDEVEFPNKFQNVHCNYHRLKNYFSADTEIIYIGNNYRFFFLEGDFRVQQNGKNGDYALPKIMYVPAERNFLSVVDRPWDLEGLPSPLYTFLEEYDKALFNLSEQIELPIGNLNFEFQKEGRIPRIIGKDYKIKITEASSGLQSVVPLYIVSDYLVRNILAEESDSSRKKMSLEETKQLKARIREINQRQIPDEAKKALLDELLSKFVYDCFINVVEEVEQNLYPTSQKAILFKLIAFANLSEGNELILTTHSPYIINYISLAIQGDQLRKKINGSSNKTNLIEKLNKIIPIQSLIPSEDVSIYQVGEVDGSITKLSSFEGIPSDNNFLNMALREGNMIFDSLLELEEQL